MPTDDEIGASIAYFYKDKYIESKDLFEMTRLVEELIQKDSTIKNDPTIQSYDPILIPLIETAYNTYMNEKIENDKKKKENDKIYQEFQAKVNDAYKKDLPRFLSQQSYRDKPVQSKNNPIVKEETALGGTRHRGRTRRGKRGRTRRRSRRV